MTFARGFKACALKPHNNSNYIISQKGNIFKGIKEFFGNKKTEKAQKFTPPSFRRGNRYQITAHTTVAAITPSALTADSTSNNDTGVDFLISGQLFSDSKALFERLAVRLAMRRKLKRLRFPLCGNFFDLCIITQQEQMMQFHYPTEQQEQCLRYNLSEKRPLFFRPIYKSNQMPLLRKFLFH